MNRLSPEEYGRLSDQKAEDWRQISRVNPMLFGVAGAIFAAGVAETQALILAMAPMPLFIGIFHMIRSAKLQMQMITYMARAPEGAGRWEADITRLLPPVWAARQSMGLGKVLGFIERPSAWNTWLAIALATDILVNATSWIADYNGAPAASVGGFVAAVIAAGLLACQAKGIEKERKMWTAAWGEAEKPDTTQNDIERAARDARLGE